MNHNLGRQIQDESFAIVERRIGKLSLPPWAFAVLKRMIHATADFEFGPNLRYSPTFEKAIAKALKEQVPIVTDTEMLLIGIRSSLGVLSDVPVCYLNDPETLTLAESAGITRSAAGIRLAARKHAGPVLAIGNAPTALEEAMRLVNAERWRPAAIIGMPVGFVGVEAAKKRLMQQQVIPFLSCHGLKGGSGVTAAAVNALVEWFGETVMNPGGEAERERLWAQLEARAQRLLEHPKDLEPREPIRRYNSLLRLWHEPAFAPRRSWTVLLPGRTAAPDTPPLVREVLWDRQADQQRLFAEPAASDARLTLGLRDAYLPAAELHELIQEGTRLAVPVLGVGNKVGLDGDYYGVETYEVSPFVRLQWWCDGPAEWRHFTAWVAALRVFFVRHITMNALRTSG